MQRSDYSPALPSSQIMGTATLVGSVTGHSSARSASNSRRPSKASSRDSQASFTSFESLGSDDDPTPPQEEDRRLSPVHESPVTNLRYPKIPRPANQAVPRSSASPLRGQREFRSEVSPLQPSPITPQKTAANTSVQKQGIGNKLWKTEISPQGTRPQYAIWPTPIMTQTRANGQTYSWATGSSSRQERISAAPSTVSGSGSGITKWEIQNPAPFSPFGPMPKLTPKRMGEDLYLSVNR